MANKPNGKGGGQQIVQRVRLELARALDVNARKNKHLHVLLAEQIEADAAGTLNKISKFLPHDVNITGAGSEFALALADVATRIQEANRIIDAKPVHLSGEDKGEHVQDAVIIDENADNLEPEADMVPKTKKKSGRPSRFATEKPHDDA